MLPQEVFTEMEEKYGEVEEMNVCDNLGDHLVGNVYVKVRGGRPSQWPRGRGAVLWRVGSTVTLPVVLRVQCPRGCRAEAVGSGEKLLPTFGFLHLDSNETPVACARRCVGS